METNHQTKSIARRNFMMSIFSWGVLAVLAVIVNLMERYTMGESYIVYSILNMIVIILFVNTVLFLWEFVQGIRIRAQNPADRNDPVINIHSLLSMILGLVGALVSIWIYFVG